jgi:hypothetical protein
VLADLQGDGLGDERLADAGLADEQQRASVLEPAEALDLADLRLGDRATRGVVEVVEADAGGQLGGLQAPLRGALTTVVGLGLQ